MKCREMTVRFKNPSFNSQCITPRDGTSYLIVGETNGVLTCGLFDSNARLRKCITWPTENIQEWCCDGVYHE